MLSTLASSIGQRLLSDVTAKWRKMKRVDHIRKKISLVSCVLILCQACWGAEGQTPQDGGSSPPKQEEQLCRAIELPIPTFETWQNDHAYNVIEANNSSGKRIHIVGDELLVNAATMPSLVRHLGEPMTGVSELILDARHVRVESPLILESARITILANKLSIGKDGYLGVVGPSAESGDGLFIYAGTANFRESLPRPFALFPGSDKQKRQLRILAGSLIVNGNEIAKDEAVETVWRKTFAYKGGKTKGYPDGFHVDISESARTAVREVHLADASWPLFFGAKLRRFYARDPFSDANRETIIGLLDTYESTVIEVGTADAVRSVAATRRLWNSEIDMLGNGRGFIPRRDLVDSIREFDSFLQSAFVTQPYIAELVAHADSRQPVDTQQLTTLRDDLDAVRYNIASAKDEMTTALTKLASNEAAAVEINKQIAERVNELRKRLDELREKDKELADIKGATSVLSFGAALIPGAGPFIAAGIAATGEAVYRHNAGEEFSVESFASIAQKGAAFYAATKAAQSSWESHSEDLDRARRVWDGDKIRKSGSAAKGNVKYFTKKDAAVKSAKSAADFAKSLDAMNEQLQDLPIPTRVGMNELEAQDARLNTLIAALAEKRSIQAKLLEVIKNIEKTIALGVSSELEMAAAVDAVLSAQVDNDRDILRWKVNSIALWRNKLENLYLMAIMLRASVYFETGKTLTIPSNVFQFPEEFISNQLLTDSGLVETKELLDEQTKHRVALESFSNAAKNAKSQYAAERAGPVSPYIQRFRFSNKKGSPSISVRFIEELNRQIQSQMTLEENQPGVRVMSPLLIPITLPSPPVDGPERLVGIELSELQFENDSALNAKLLNFDVSYQLMGELWTDGECKYVDMRTPGSRPMVVKRFSSNDAIAKTDMSVLPLTFQEYTRYQAAPPARTPYFISAQVTGNTAEGSWKNVPKVKSIVISLRLVQ